jgi:hypothetical protein
MMFLYAHHVYQIQYRIDYTQVLYSAIPLIQGFCEKWLYVLKGTDFSWSVAGIWKYRDSKGIHHVTFVAFFIQLCAIAYFLLSDFFFCFFKFSFPSYLLILCLPSQGYIGWTGYIASFGTTILQILYWMWKESWPILRQSTIPIFV